MPNGAIALAAVVTLILILQMLAAATGESNRRPRVEPTNGRDVLWSLVIFLIVVVPILYWAANRDHQERIRNAKYHRTFTNEVD